MKQSIKINDLRWPRYQSSFLVKVRSVIWIFVIFVAKTGHRQPVPLFIERFYSFFLGHHWLLGVLLVGSWVKFIWCLQSNFRIVIRWAFKRRVFVLHMHALRMPFFLYAWLVIYEFYSFVTRLSVGWSDPCFEGWLPFFWFICFLFVMLSPSSAPNTIKRVRSILVYLWVRNVGLWPVELAGGVSLPFVDWIGLLIYWSDHILCLSTLLRLECFWHF